MDRNEEKIRQTLKEMGYTKICHHALLLEKDGLQYIAYLDDSGELAVEELTSPLVHKVIEVGNEN